ncbi:pyridoxamine 5'-phosphate oxidase family protein [Clostridium formicaceticum]|uniref:Pyridoxamine 5'-phosphate oxidase n=1 Tax=Clostridium formicaceticum TaxID=1497 RepID=A0AAC9RM17_9CLOT|nr:pyridoxamine 5'-phosphate oxidase family protein [Clostridium formicaceticum]AOY75144.1 pyridoxamine 5'-phosphate oxidase [Clostridium formicaceticum]ARE89569.1 Pyridoxamine 5'-phosphate oxidase [Clostridium formicaceticum]
MDRKMAPLELRQHIIEFLREHKSASLATCKDGIARCSPVQYFLGEEMDLYILSAGGEKFKAIQQNPNVCLLVNTEYINYKRIKGIQVFGQATICAQDRRVYEEAMKYNPDNEIVTFKGNQLKAIKIVPTEVVYLDALESGDRTKQILRHEEVILQQDDLLMMH